MSFEKWVAVGGGSDECSVDEYTSARDDGGSTVADGCDMLTRGGGYVLAGLMRAAVYLSCACVCGGVGAIAWF
jgi:hypothetical protein